MLAGRAAIQGDLGKLQKWADGNLRTLSKHKLEVLHLGCSSLWQWHKLGAGWLESISIEKDLRVLVDNELNTSQKCALTATKPALARE